MYIETFLEYLSLEKKYSSHTVLAYNTDLTAFKDFCVMEFNRELIESVHYNQIRKWIISLVNQNVSNRSINRKVNSLKAFYKYLRKIEVIEISPLSKHKSLKFQKKAGVPFSSSEVENVLNRATNSDFISLRNKLIIELFYTTGIRRFELINIKNSDVNIGSKIIKVLGKGNKERLSPLLPSVINSLEKYVRYKKENNYASEFLFITEKGNKIYETLVYRIINHYFSEVSTKVKKSPHILRHTFATQLLNQGADLNSVKELLGHSSLASTQVYTHSNLEQLKQVFNQAHPRSKKKD